MPLIQNDYRWIKAFREYVDGYAAEHDIAPEEALEHEVVRRGSGDIIRSCDYESGYEISGK